MDEREREIRERLQKATPGPWVRWEGHADVFCGNDGENSSFSISGNQIASCDPDDLPDFDGELCDDEDAYQIQAENNAEFIANAPTDIQHLLSLLDAERKRVQELEGALGKLVKAERKLLPICPIVTHHRTDCPYCEIIAARIEAESLLSKEPK